MLPGVGAGLTFLADSLAASLLWVIDSTEDAADLINSLPLKHPQYAQHEVVSRCTASFVFASAGTRLAALIDGV